MTGRHTVLQAIPASSSRVAIGDLDGDHRNEIVACGPDALTVLDASGKKLAQLTIVDGIQKLVVADLDSDGSAEIYAGWGQTREHMDTKARFSVLHFGAGALREENIVTPATTRQDVVSIVPVFEDRTMYLMYFESKYIVASVRVWRDRQTWIVQEAPPTFRMASSFARGDVDADGYQELVIGRVYGDDVGLDGDASVNTSRRGLTMTIPTTRGVRSAAVIDGAVYLGDGWHKNYGTEARGLFSRATFDVSTNAFVTKIIEDTPGQYAIEAIIPATIENRRVIVTQGTKYTRAFRPNGDKWEAVTFAGLARDVAVGDLDGKPGDEILILGETAEIVSLEGATWSPIP
ncbi:MAG TPA: hypothetical protein VMZ53_27760 [Kofleriaceae bacterium]|nr:hypothetical protein [Kofleriaceae bacterium]